MRENVIARGQCLEQSHRRCRSTPKSSSGRAAFQRADSLLQRLTIWVVVARVHEPARVGALHVALKSGGEMNRSRNCAGGGIDCVAGVDSQSFYTHRIVDLSTGRGIDSSNFLLSARAVFHLTRESFRS